jgi:microcystin-dependent protein
MLITDLTVEVRNASLARVGQILPSDLSGLELALRYNKVGTWKLSLRSDHPLANSLRAPGAGLIVTGPSGVLISGPTVTATQTKTSDDLVGEWEIVGVEDTVILGERLAYPTPTTADVTLQENAYDIRTGPAETVVKAYVNANIGPSAPTARKITGLTIDTDLGRGSTVTGAARFERLGELCSNLLGASELGFDVVQSGAALMFRVYQPTNRSAYIRMDVDNRRLIKTEYTYTAPQATRVIVAGQGEGSNRTFLERSNATSTTTETTWGRRIEYFKDERNTSDTATLETAGDLVLSDIGKTIEGIKFTPSDDQTMRYGVDWGLGDKVTVVAGTSEIVQVVTEVALVVGDFGVAIGGTLGDPVTAESNNPEARTTSSVSSQDSRISNLERNSSNALVWNDAAGTYEFLLKGGDVTLQVGQEQVVRVKNATGATLTKGTVVYPTGSDGVNKTVAKSQADAESTSTNTFAVLMEDIGNGQKGFGSTFGVVDGLNTSALTEGAAVYLSPTVAGGLTSTKPSAPNHMVLVGFCIRSHASQGVLFVKIQNGFELQELHDVAITSPADGDTIVYNSGTWQNSPSIPTGSLLQWVTATAPNGYLLCNGDAVSRTTYANLWNVLRNGTSSSPYGNGDGSTTFNLPDLQGRVPVGYKAPASLGTATITVAAPGVVTRATHRLSTGQIVYFTTTGALPTGLTANTRYFAIVVTSSTFRLATTQANALAGTAITTTGTQSGTHTVFTADFDLGRANGEVNHTQTLTELVAHTHTAFRGNDNNLGGLHGWQAIDDGTVGSASNSTGGSLPMNNLQSYLTLNYVIKY